MGRHVDRSFIISLLDQFYMEQQNYYDFCLKYNCNICNKSKTLEQELRRWGFNTTNINHKKWFIIYYQKSSFQITLFPVYI